MALGRMEYQAQDRSVTYHSDKPTGPTASSETMDVLEFLARLTSHIPSKGQVLQRYYGWYSSRLRGMTLSRPESTLIAPHDHRSG
ncbi:MAG: transposase, partial [Gemmatimonadales bacterium]